MTASNEIPAMYDVDLAVIHQIQKDENKRIDVSLMTEEEIIDKAREIARSRLASLNGSPITSNTKLVRYMDAIIGNCEREVFGVLFMDNQHHPIKFEEMFFGSLGGAAVYPREVVKAALKCNAGAVILVHNHPSGTTEVSSADKHITARLKDALELIDVRVLDHFIVGAGNYMSFKEQGLM